MNFEKLEELWNISKKDFENECEKILIVDLIARIEKWEGILKKNDLGMPALIGKEITPKRQKLSALLHILTSVRDRKEKERYELGKKERETWRDDYLAHNLRDFRFIIGTEAEHVMHGDYPVNTVPWATPQSTEYEITGTSGNKIKINLKRIIAPATLQMLIDHPLVPVYLVVEPTGAYQHGKKLGYFVSGEWDQTRGIEIRLGTMFALMKV
jgi:hypothetical protein